MRYTRMFEYIRFEIFQIVLMFLIIFKSLFVYLGWPTIKQTFFVFPYKPGGARDIWVIKGDNSRLSSKPNQLKTINQTKPTKDYQPNQINSRLSTKPNQLKINNQTKPTEDHQPNQTNSRLSTKPNQLKIINQTKPTQDYQPNQTNWRSSTKPNQIKIINQTKPTQDYQLN